VRKRHAVIGLSVLLLAAAAACSPAVARREGAPAPEVLPVAPRGETGIEERWGIKVIAVRLSGAGQMLDFRFRVVDAAKAAPLFARETKPQLIDQASGRSFAVPNMPKIGPLRTSDPPRPDTNYWMLFNNTARIVAAGSKVTVVIGEFRVEDLVVE
jgi:hypothetical protein